MTLLLTTCDTSLSYRLGIAKLTLFIPDTCQQPSLIFIHFHIVIVDTILDLVIVAACANSIPVCRDTTKLLTTRNYPWESLGLPEGVRQTSRDLRIQNRTEQESIIDIRSGQSAKIYHMLTL